MKKIKIKNFKGNEYEGIWNEKFYDSIISDRKELIRIYIDNKAIHITEEEKENLVNSIYQDKVEQDNARIKIIKENFEKLDLEAQKALIDYFQLQIS